MDRKALKEQLHRQIEDLNNDALLQQINSLIEINTGIEEPYKLSPDEKSAVQEGWNDYTQGNTISDDDLDKKLDAWIGK